MKTLEEILEKYGDAELLFESYYKYNFVFSGVYKDGAIIRATYGGNSDDVYRIDICAKSPETLKYLEPIHVLITKGGEVLADWDDY